VKALVRYCYVGRYTSGEYEECSEVELFKLADEFDFDGLKHYMMERLSCNGITKENALDLAVRADEMKAPDLMKVGLLLIAHCPVHNGIMSLFQACARVIFAHQNEIFSSDQWKALKAKKSAWLLDLLEVGCSLPDPI